MKTPKIIVSLLLSGSLFLHPGTYSAAGNAVGSNDSLTEQQTSSNVNTPESGQRVQQNENSEDTGGQPADSKNAIESKPQPVQNSNKAESVQSQSGQATVRDGNVQSGSTNQGNTIKAASDQSEVIYFKAVKQETLVYIRKNDRLVSIAALQGDQEFISKTQLENWHIIQLGDKEAFIKKVDTLLSDGTSITNRTSLPNSTETISLLNDVPVYENESTSIPFAKLFSGDSYQVISSTDAGYFVNVGGRAGFIKKTDIVREFTTQDKYFTVLTEKQPVYIKQGSKLVQKGSLLKGKEFARLKGDGKWHLISYGSQTGFVAIEGTAPSAGKTIVKAEPNSRVSLTIKTDTVVYEGTSLTTAGFATLLKAEKYPIVSRAGDWFKVNYAGRIGYVHPYLASTNYVDAANTKGVYTYEQLGSDAKTLEIMYPGLVKTEVIGKSVDGRNLYAIKLGKGKKEIFFNGSHHAREHMTTNVLMEMADQYALSYAKGTTYGGYKTRAVLNNVSIWFVPMLNPDGVTLVQKGHLSAKNPAQVLKLNNGKKDFSAWKANIRGVDLNRQYPANWASIDYDAKKPGPKNFKGYKPLSEPEVIAIVNFVKKHSFKTAVAYHSSGNILYWHYGQTGSRYTRDYTLAKRYGSLTGYSLVAPSKNPSKSGGGFKDWFIMQTKMPGFTPEISKYVGERPVPVSYFPSVWSKNYKAGLMLADDASRR
ncbi:hypothetical protein CVD28_09120 [Bacillus sp. M6-12]|uniref:M14 family metallocarboxypeptidase n=1 Tax=Bacillus sp. M6-12 TaxID=2054166 RepID=UPI000C760CF0|nr:M14 family metallocarboxypeptidase [Bacillus sp. M6-12]PLS17850.1 hypothetical protein CVD28_09120 [Bacillus sp. M6-12]